MKYKSFADMNCSLAQSLEVLGERWTLLILRDAFRGVRRFDEFLATGISRNILTTRWFLHAQDKPLPPRVKVH